MTHYNCPVDGCEYGDNEEKSLAAVRAHINASGDGRHDWADLKAAVEEQADDAAETEPEPDAEQADAADDGGSDTGADEYAEQVNDALEPDAIEEPGETDDDATDGGESGNGSGPGLAVLAGTAALGLAVLLSRSSDDGATKTTETDSSTDSSTATTPEPLR